MKFEPVITAALRSDNSQLRRVRVRAHTRRAAFLEKNHAPRVKYSSITIRMNRRASSTLKRYKYSARVCY